MSKKMTDLCEWVLNTAKKAGANDCKVEFGKRRFVDIQYREKKPETVKEATTQNINVEIFINNRYSSQSTSDLRKDALKKFIEDMISNTKLLEEDPYRSLPDPKYYKGRKEIDLKIYDPNISAVSAENRHKMAKELESACLERGGDKVVSVTSEVYDDFQEETVMTSNGFYGEQQATTCYGFASMTAQDEGDRRPQGYDYCVARIYNKLEKPERIGISAAEKTLELMGGKKIKTETLPIIIENRNVPRALSGLGDALSGWAIQQKRSFLIDKKGEKIASEKFTVVDDPFIIEGLGSRLYDGDGFAAKKRVIFEQGVLKEYLIDWYRSRKLGMEPTTGGTSNIVIPAGERSVKTIMKDLGRGILINGFIGGNSNSNTGDFSVGITGHLFDKGEIQHAIAEMNIADNHLAFWNKLVEIADDPWKYSSWLTPSLVFKDVVVSGA